MELIGVLIELALQQASDLCVIDWFPGEDDAPESYIAEVEISQNFHPARDGFPAINDFIVILNNYVFCLIDAVHLECWHASKIEQYV